MQKFKQFNELNEVEAKWAVNRNNPDSPFSKFIGNDAALKKLQVIAYDALQKHDHCCRDLALALFGPASVGKTTLAKLFGKVLNLPFVEISPKAICSLDDLFNEINRVLTIEGIELSEWGDNKHYYLPSCIIFIDEIHALAKGMIQGLLKATEHNDGMLVTESGKVLNCFNACWMIATTDEGRLFDAFRTRFSTVKLNYLSKYEISEIIQLHQPNLPFEICELVAHYNSRIPRKALEFVRYMKLLKSMNYDSWENVAKEVAKNEGIDDFGMSSVHLTALKALSHGAVAKNRMPIIIGCKIEEVENFIMPWLLVESEEQPALVKVTHSGYILTSAGMEELRKRGICCAV